MKDRFRLPFRLNDEEIAKLNKELLPYGCGMYTCASFCAVLKPDGMVTLLGCEGRKKDFAAVSYMWRNMRKIVSGYEDYMASRLYGRMKERIDYVKDIVGYNMNGEQ